MMVDSNQNTLKDNKYIIILNILKQIQITLTIILQNKTLKKNKNKNNNNNNNNIYALVQLKYIGIIKNAVQVIQHCINIINTTDK